MAIEDEIINITDIDVGTEILNNDKLIIETNNGTKLLAFKDLVIGEDNITFKDKLVQGTDATGSSSTRFSTVTGYRILTSDTTAGHLTKYADISGTVELGKFNYNGVAKFAELSATIAQNEAGLALANDNLTTINQVLQNSSSADLAAITITLSATNFKISTADSASNGTKGVGFSNVDLNPTDTNPDCSFTENPFTITYPSVSDASYTASWILYIADIIVSYNYNQKVILYINNSAVASSTFSKLGLNAPTAHGWHAKLQTFQYVPAGAKVTLQFTGSGTATRKGTTFAGIKLG